MKILFQYILMVGTAALGVYGLLRLGANLKAPVSVGGVWSLALASPSDNTDDCDILRLPPEGAALAISQSGPNLVVYFKGASQITLQGRIEGITVTAQTRRETQDAYNLHLLAQVDRHAEPDQLRATLKSDACPDPISLVGTRQPRSQNTSGGD